MANHHTNLRRELPRLAERVAEVVAAHADIHPEVTEDLLPHLAKQERVLFPRAIELLVAVEPAAFHWGSVADPIGSCAPSTTGSASCWRPCATGRATTALPTTRARRALDAGPADLEADTHVHVHLENDVLLLRIMEVEGLLARR